MFEAIVVAQADRRQECRTTFQQLVKQCVWLVCCTLVDRGSGASRCPFNVELRRRFLSRSLWFQLFFKHQVNERGVRSFLVLVRLDRGILDQSVISEQHP